MLCKSCDKERFERFLNSKRTAGAGNSGDNTQTTRRVGLRSNAKPEANKNSSASSSSSVYGSVKESKGSDRDTAHTVLTAHDKEKADNLVTECSTCLLPADSEDKNGLTCNICHGYTLCAV